MKPIPSIQSQADAILAKALTVVCDGGWGGNHHPRRVLKVGDPERVSHTMCPECAEAVEREMEDEVRS